MQRDSINIVYPAYLNARALIKFRGVALKSDDVLSGVAFTKQFQDQLYYKVAGDGLSVVLIQADSKYAKKKEFPNLMDKVVDGDTIFIVEANEMGNLASVLTRANKQMHNITVGIYDHIMYNYPEHILSSKYEKVSSAEIQQLLDNEYISLNEIPAINSTDVGIFWYGMKKGDIVREISLSETSLKAIRYKLVISDGRKIAGSGRKKKVLKRK